MLADVDVELELELDDVVLVLVDVDGGHPALNAPSVVYILQTKLRS